MAVKFYQPENQVPLEMHKVRVVQKLNLIPVEERLRAIQAAGNNTFLLQNRDIYMDMITDSGVNGMSDQQVAAMQVADDSYAGSETWNRAKAAVKTYCPPIRDVQPRISLPRPLSNPVRWLS